ncbi:putative transposase, Ptta/En/Spm, plant [Helianthus anomalus]
MADVAGMSDNNALSHDVSRDIVNDNDFGAGDNGDGSDDGDNGGDSDGGIGDEGVDRGGDDGGGDDGGDGEGKEFKGHKIPAGKYNLLSNVDFHQMGYLLRCGNGCVVSGTLKNGKKKSEAGKSNRKNDLCIHTGGSIGFDEHRANMENKEGKKVGYKKVFFQTHATKQCKKRIQDGEIDENDFKNLEFVTKRAKNSYISYHLLFFL